MNYGPLLFLGIFASFSLSWLGLIYAPQTKDQIGQQPIAVMEDSGISYPSARPGQANQGEQVYRSLGCAACHTQVVRGRVDVPRFGPRFTVAQDYLFDSPAMIGSQRLGPDLKNVGLRQPDINWHFQHLYNPRSIKGSEKSTMPRYPFLFAQRKLARDEKKTDNKIYDGEYEMVPTPDARALVQYLLSLHAEIPLFEAPIPQAKTNAAPAAVTAETNAPAADATANTNPPAK